MNKTYRSQNRKPRTHRRSKTPKRRVRTHRKKLARKRVQTRRRKIYVGGENGVNLNDLQVFFERFLNDISSMNKLRNLFPETYENHTKFDKFLVEQYNDMFKRFDVNELNNFLNDPQSYRIVIPKSKTITNTVLNDLRTLSKSKPGVGMIDKSSLNKFDLLLKKHNNNKEFDPIKALEYMLELYDRVTLHNQQKLGSVEYYRKKANFEKNSDKVISIVFSS